MWSRALPLCLALALPCTAVAQEDDRGYLTAWLEDNLSGAGRQITITGFEGALSSRATIARLAIADDQGEWISLTNVVLDWNRAALLSGQVSINALTADEIVVTRAPVTDAATLPTPEAQPFTLPELPVSVEIGQIAAARIVLGEDLLGLPVEGRIDAAAVLSGGEGRASLTLERTDEGPDGLITLAASYANASRMLVLDLSAEEDAGGIAATLLDLPGAPAVSLTVKGSGVIDDFRADVRLATDDRERLAGTVTLSGEEDGAQGFDADLSGDLAPLFAPDYAAFFGNSVALKASGARAASGRLDLRELAVETTALALNGTVSLAPDGLPETVDITGTLAMPDGTPVLLPIASATPTRVARADLTLKYAFAQSEGWTAALLIDGLDRPDLAADRLSVTGSGRISRGPLGAVIGGTFRYAADGLSPADPAIASALGTAISGKAVAHWRQGDDAVSLPQLTLDGAGMALSAGGRIEGLSTGFAVSGQIDARIADLSRFSLLAGRPLAGSGTIAAKGGGSVLGGAFDVEGGIDGRDIAVGQENLDRLLRGASRIGFSVQRDVDGLKIRALDVSAGTLAINASGTVATASSDITARLDFADLAVLGADYGGSLKGTARFVGPLTGGNLTLDADGQGLAMGVAEVDNLLKGPAKVSLDALIAPDAVTVRRLSVAAASLTAGITGRLATAGSDVAAELRFDDLAVLGRDYRGALDAQARFQGTAADGQITLDGRGTNLGIGQREADTLLRGESKVSLAARISGGGIRIDSALLSNPQVQAEATGTVGETERRLNISARLANLALILPEFPGPVTVSGTAVEDGRGYTIDLRGQGPGGIDAAVAGRIAADFRDADLGIRGRAQAGLANAFIDPASVAGNVDFDLRLSGPLAMRALSGRVSMAGGRIVLPGAPAALQDVSLRADLSAERARIDGNLALSTGGRVNLAGSVGLGPTADADLQVILDRIVLRDPQLYETRANGNLTVTGPLTGGALIAGRVALLETELRVPSTSLGPSGEDLPLRHLGDRADVRATRLRAGVGDGSAAAGGSATGSRPFALDVQISAPNRVFVRGRGLDAELGGALQIRGTTDAIIPDGGLSLIRGRLDILGTRLVLSEATLLLSGQFVPFITVRAANESDGITSFVSIEGPADDPEVRFASVPELPQEEVLARLLFGRGLESISAFQAAQLASAVATLAGRGGDGIIGRLRKGFGLDDLDVATSEDGTASLRAGKYLSRNVYTEIEVDQDGKSQINLNLDVNRNVTVRGRLGSDGETGIGVFIERDY